MSSKRQPRRPNSRTASRKQTVDTLSGPSGLARIAAEQSVRDFAEALDLAEKFNNLGREKEIVSLLSPYEIRYPFEDKLTCGQFDRLLGFGYAHDRRWDEAEHHLERGHKLFPESLDFLYGLTYVRMSLRSFQAACDSADNYIRILNDVPANQRTSQPFNGTQRQRALLLNFRGLCLTELQRTDDAIKAFRDSIEQDSKAHHAYLNLANLYLRQNNSEKAREIIDAGTRNCTQVQELRMLAGSLANKATISACLIVKNEEELLPGCLDSIRSWVDELIIVDTGSTDRTIEIARSYGAKVYEHPWEGSFSKARNFSLQYATKDWLFIIDADERVYAEDIPQIIAAVNQPDGDVITTNVYNVYEEFKDVVVFLPSHRFFRRSLNVHYEGIVHNQLCVPETARYIRTGVRIKHLGYGLSREKMQAKTIRTKTLLEKQLAENPDNAFALFNYAQLLRSTPDGFHKEYAPLILKAAGRAVELTQVDNATNRHIHLMCLDQLAWTHYYLGNYDQALEYSQRALDAKPDYLDPILLRGYLYFKRNDLPKATFYFEKYLTTQAAYEPSKELENIILVHLNARTDALFNLGAMAEMRGDVDSAKRYYRQVLSINVEYAGANLNLGRLLLSEGHHSEAEDCLQRVVEHGQASPDICARLAQLYVERGEAQKAESTLLRGLKNSPSNSQLLEALGDLYSASGQFDEVVAALEKGYSANRDSIGLTAKLATALIQTGQVRRAIEVYTDFASRHSLTAEMQNDLGNCYYRLQKFAEAETAYRKALEMHPRLAPATRNLGLTLAVQKKTNESIAALQQCLEVDSQQVELYHVIGDLQVASGRHLDALNSYEKYLQKYPTDVTALCRLSDCYLALGHEDSAILGYRRVLELDPSFAPAEKRLADITGSSKVPEISNSKSKV